MSPHPRSRRLVLAAAAVAAAGASASVRAQCLSEDFESFPLGSAVTGIAPGVTVAAEPASCPGGVDVIVIQPAAGTSSGTRALSVEAGCPSFSPERLVVRFSDPQSTVTFTVGTTIGENVVIRAYESFSGGGVAWTDTTPTTAATSTFVRVGQPGDVPWIRRIEIEADSFDFESIDDLAWNDDATAPQAVITEPAFLSCFCESEIILFRGIACDLQGTYRRDVLEYRPFGAAPGDPWQTLGEAFSPLCTEGTLYAVPASSLPDGSLLVRLTVENECGRSNTALTAVRVDRAAPGVAIERPLPGPVDFGTVEVCGAVGDACSVTWELGAVPESGGPGAFLIASGTSGDCGALGSFDTADLAPGGWKLELVATDDCGQTSATTTVIEVLEDCGGTIGDLDGDGVVGFNDLLILLAAFGG